VAWAWIRAEASKVRLSRKCEYACLAMIDLAERHEEGVVSAGGIAKRKSIPKKYLDQILHALKTSGYLRSVRGAQGGYRLAKAPEQISLAEIIRLMDGSIAPTESVSQYFYQKTPIETSRKVLEVFRDIRDYAARKLENTTLADIV